MEESGALVRGENQKAMERHHQGRVFLVMVLEQNLETWAGKGGARCVRKDVEV